MKALLTLLFALLLFVSCDSDDGPQITGSGNVITEQRSSGTFENIRIESVINATITFGTTSSVVVRADDNIIDLVTTQFIQDDLVVGLEDGSYDDITVEVIITQDDISSITTTGVNNVSFSGFEQLDDLTITSEGVGNFTLAGSSDLLTINSNGSSNLFGFGFTATECAVNLTGVGNVEITVLERLTGNLSGVGNIQYRGTPDVNVNVSGVGNVINAN